MPTRAKRNAYLAAGICGTCGHHKLDSAMSECARCRSLRIARHAKHRAGKHCACGGTKQPATHRCADCAAKYRAYIIARHHRPGRCSRCGIWLGEKWDKTACTHCMLELSEARRKRERRS